MTLEVGYKVVRRERSLLPRWDRYSFLAFAREVRYAPYEYTRPHRGWGPLCVFDSRADAYNFLRRNKCHPDFAPEIWLVAYVPSRARAVRSPGLPPSPLADLPHGTRLARAVGLLVCVWPEDAP